MSSFHSLQLQGWLLKQQRHGLRKSWLRRYFVLDGDELRYYKNENDIAPQGMLHLDEYQIVTDVMPVCQPSLLKKQPSRQFTFLLVSNDEDRKKDLFLQAESQEELDVWVDALQQQQQQQVHEPTSVLDKWLERLDIQTNIGGPSTQKYQHHRGDSTGSSFLLSPRPTTQEPSCLLRGQHSIESITSTSSSRSSIRSSFTERRRTSNPSTTTSSSSSSTFNNTSTKFLSNLFQHWPRPSFKTPARDVADDEHQERPVDTPPPTVSTTNPMIISPIIHPSEYNSAMDIATQQQQHHRSASSSLTSRRNVQISPITSSSRLSRGRSCSSLGQLTARRKTGEQSQRSSFCPPSSSSSSSSSSSFPRALTSPSFDLRHA